MAVNSKLLARVQAIDSSVLDMGGSTIRHELEVALNILDGVDDGDADEVWTHNHDLATGTETHDLTNLTQLDANGSTVRSGINFAVVKLLMTVNREAVGTAGQLRMGGAGANPFDGDGSPFQVAGGKIDIPGGGVWLWWNPAGVSTSSANNLLIEAATADQEYDLIVLGESA